MEPLDYCSNFLIGGYNSDGSTRLYSLVEEDELLASIRGRIMKKIALINPPFRGVIHRIKDAYPLGLGYIKHIAKVKGLFAIFMIFLAHYLAIKLWRKSTAYPIMM